MNTVREQLRIEAPAGMGESLQLGQYVEGYAKPSAELGFWDRLRGKKAAPTERVYVFSGGFVWLTPKDDGTEEKTVVRFSEVANIFLPATRGGSNGTYERTIYQLRILGRDGSMMMDRVGSYVNEDESEKNASWEWIVLDAISDQWERVLVDVVNNALNQRKALNFINSKQHVILTLDSITCDGVTMRRGEFEWQRGNGELRLRRKAPQNINMNNYTSGPDELVIDVNTMGNRRTFLACLTGIFGIK
jgi:hypothetical protein